MPEPTRRADKIAMKAAEILDQDRWDSLSDTTLKINDVSFNLDKCTTRVLSVNIRDDGAQVLMREPIHAPYRDVVSEALGRAVNRRRESDLKSDEQNIRNDAYHADKAKREAARQKRQARKERSEMFWVVAIIGIATFVFVGGISSCVHYSDKAEQADLDQVNEYGFRKGDIPYDKRNWEYPDDCFKDGAGYAWTQSLKRCKRTLRDWERDGTVWVEWGDE